MIVLLKILSIILYIIGGCIVMYGLSLDTIREKNTPLKYFLCQNRGFVILIFVLVGIQIIQFGYMCWDNSAPYIIIDTEDDEPWILHWTNTIRNKFIAASVLGLFYYIVLFFERKREFAKYENSEYEINELRKEHKELKHNDHISYKKWGKTLQDIVENLDDEAHIYIKCKNGNVYRLGHNSWFGELIYRESSKEIFFLHEDSPNLEDIAYAIYRNDANIIAITSKTIKL